jgi:hypothetical protein
VFDDAFDCSIIGVRSVFPDGSRSSTTFDANDSVTVLGVTGLTASDFHFVI